MQSMSTVTTSPDQVEEHSEPRVRSIDSLMIARATHAHVPYLRRLKERVMQSRYHPAADDEQEFERWRDVYCTENYFTSIIDSPNCLLLCIGTIREPVGMVVLRSSDHEKHIEIDDLLVLKPRLGDGTRLLVAALRYAEIWRSRDVHIDVYPGNEQAEEFLREHGFVFARNTENDLGRPMLRFERAIA